jgi:hypothetical protein
MTDFYLKFNSQAQAETELEGVEAIIDVIGEIYTTQKPIQNGTAEVDTGEGIVTIPTYQYFEPVKQSGYHVNMRIDELPENLVPFVINPQNPVRTWL